jgi:predicted PilT family ATPase
MIKRDEKPVYSESRWQTVAELSPRGELGCELEAAEKVAKILVSVHIPDRILMEVKQAVTKVMEKEMSNIVADQAQRIFTIRVRTQVSQSLETPANEADSRESLSRLRAWGFFLTEKRASETELGNKMNHVVINIHLYQEGRPS